MLTPTKRQSWHFKRGILKERDLLKKRQSAKLILVPGHCSFRGVNCSKNGCNREIFSFNVMVYFLSVQQFYSHLQRHLNCHHPSLLALFNCSTYLVFTQLWWWIYKLQHGGVCRLCIWICTFKIAFLFFPIDLTIQISTNTFFEYPLS